MSRSYLVKEEDSNSYLGAVESEDEMVRWLDLFQALCTSSYFHKMWHFILDNGQLDKIYCIKFNNQINDDRQSLLQLQMTIHDAYNFQWNSSCSKFELFLKLVFDI